MPAGVTFGPTGPTYAAGKSLFSPTISTIIDQAQQVAGIGESDSVLNDLGFTKYTPLTPDETFTAARPITPAPNYGEGESTPSIKRDESYRKTTKMEKFGDKIAVSDEFLAWVESGKTIDGADSSVRRELDRFANDTVSLMQSLDLTKSILATSVLGFGTQTKDYGPGSLDGDGKALFADDHPNGGFTLDNNASTALDATNLLAAITAMKGFKAENGMLIKVPSVFTLVVPRALEGTARALMNSVNNMAGMYAGTGSNSALLNTFFFQNQRVELLVADFLNQDSYNALRFNGLAGTIGSGTAWYLLNKEGLQKERSFKFGSLWDKRVETWRDFDTGTNYVKVSMYANADHFGAYKFAYKGNV